MNRLGHRNGDIPEIFGLEREGEADPRVLEVALQVLVDAAAGMEMGQGGDHGRGGHGAQGVEGLFQHGLEEFQLHPVVGEELPDVLGVIRGDAGDLRLEALHVTGGTDLARDPVPALRILALEHEVILRIEPLQLDVILETLAACLEDVGEDLWIEEEGRADIEAVAAGRLHRLGPAADRRVLLDHRDVDARSCEEQRRRQSPGAGADDDDAASGQGPHAIPRLKQRVELLRRQAPYGGSFLP